MSPLPVGDSQCLEQVVFSDRAPEIRAIVCMEQQQACMMEINSTMYQHCKYKLDLPVITLPFIFVMSINSLLTGQVQYREKLPKFYLKTVDA